MFPHIATHAPGMLRAHQLLPRSRVLAEFHVTCAFENLRTVLSALALKHALALLALGSARLRLSLHPLAPRSTLREISFEVHAAIARASISSGRLGVVRFCNAQRGCRIAKSQVADRLGVR